MIQGRKFAFKWTVKDFAESNSIELEVAKRLFGEIQAEARDRRQIVEKKIMRSVLQRTRRVGQESGEDVEQLELTFSFDEIKSVFEFADGFPIEDEFFSQTQGKQPETSALSHPMPHSQHPIEILRFNTCGSVDDGKSAVIGRLVTNYCAVFACRVSEECQSRASHPLSLGERVGVRGNRPSDVFAVRNRL